VRQITLDAENPATVRRALIRTAHGCTKIGTIGAEVRPNFDFRRRIRLACQAAVGGLGTAVKINCDFLAADRWKVKGKQRIVGHGGCGR
jgi:uncharacterized metal-binding protein